MTESAVHHPTPFPLHDRDDDLRHLNPPIARLSSGSVLLAGALCVLDGVQVLASVSVGGAWAAGPWALIGLGAAIVVIATKAARARSAAMLAALTACSTATLAAAAWALFAMSHGLFTLYALCAPAASLLATILAAVSLPACDRAARARARLAAEGLDLGR